MDVANEQVFELLDRIASRDEAAMADLYRLYSRRVYAFVLTRIKDAAQAEELTVDTLYEVWRAPQRFRGDSRFSTWLLGIARHKLLNALRARREEHEELDEQMPCERAGAFDLLAQSQRREAVLRCLDKLPAEQRECMHLVFYEGYSLAEVAALQGCPENTVKTRLFHARQKVKNCLRQILIQEGDHA
jgi:RNA polymerase sigma-70 factor (ECF subfamily)